jgi:UDP-N-acetylmuramyl pentapeptide synthase
MTKRHEHSRAGYKAKVQDLVCVGVTGGIGKGSVVSLIASCLDYLPPVHLSGHASYYY